MGPYCCTDREVNALAALTGLTWLRVLRVKLPASAPLLGPGGASALLALRAAGQQPPPPLYLPPHAGCHPNVPPGHQQHPLQQQQQQQAAGVLEGAGPGGGAAVGTAPPEPLLPTAAATGSRGGGGGGSNTSSALTGSSGSGGGGGGGGGLHGGSSVAVPLPPALEELLIEGGAAPAVLAALDVPPTLRTLFADIVVPYDEYCDEDVALLPAAAAALAAAVARFSGGRLGPDLSLEIRGPTDVGRLAPPPGCLAGHGVWMSALGLLGGLRRLCLCGLALDEVDTAALAAAVPASLQVRLECFWCLVLHVRRVMWVLWVLSGSCLPLAAAVRKQWLAYRVPPATQPHTAWRMRCYASAARPSRRPRCCPSAYQHTHHGVEEHKGRQNPEPVCVCMSPCAAQELLLEDCSLPLTAVGCLAPLGARGAGGGGLRYLQLSHAEEWNDEAAVRPGPREGRPGLAVERLACVLGT